jgi:hypothetical protein
MRRVFACFCIAIISSFLLFIIDGISPSYAQISNSSGIATYIPILDNEVVEGDIIIVSKEGYVLAKTGYDPNIFGVVVNDPAIAFENKAEGSYPVVSAGKVVLRVSVINGAIKKGDMLTSSTIPGVAQKVTESGFIVGTALQDYDADSEDKIGKIYAVLNVGHGNVSSNSTGSLLRALNFVLSAPYMSPLALLRYVIAGIIVLASFILAVAYFGRLSSLGIEALGRNPLAGKMILAGIVVNVVIALSIICVGLFIGYLVLVI